MNLLVLDESRLFREALRALIVGQSDHRVVVDIETLDEACATSFAEHPDIVLIDVRGQDARGIEATRRLRQLRPAPKVLLLSGCKDHRSIAQALLAGASGYVCLDQSASALLDAIRTVGRGETYVPPQISRFALDAQHAELRGVRGSDTGSRDPAPPNTSEAAGGGEPLERLTPREREVFRLLVDGETNGAIASRFQLSVKTVETHRARILRKLAVHDMAGLVRLAARTGLL